MAVRLSSRVARWFTIGVAYATAFAGVSTVAVVATSTPAFAATIAVGEETDPPVNAADCAGGTPSLCSLRDAFARAADGGTNAGADTIDIVDIDPTLTSTIAQSDNTGAVTVIGGPGVTITQSSATAGIDWTGNGFPVSFTLQDLRLTGGNVATGAAVHTLTLGTTTLDHVEIDGFSTSTAAAAGVSATQNGPLQIINGSDIHDNTATGPGQAPGVLAAGAFSAGDMTITGSSVRNNTVTGPTPAPFSNIGGAATFGQLTVSESWINNNQATGDETSRVVGGIGAQNAISIQRSTLSANAAIGDNGAATGGADSLAGTVSLTNSTVTSNSATTTNPGAAVGAANAETGVTLTYATVVNNSGANAGIRSAAGLNTFASVIVDTAPGPNCNIFGATTGGGYNFSDDTSAATSCKLSNGTDSIGGANNPDLEVLANYGGPTPTREPDPDSPLVNRIPFASCGGLNVDQRGFTRPALAGSKCDTGAVELVPTVSNAPTIGVASPGIQSATVRWQAPSFNGNAPITSFHARAAQNPAQFCNAGPAATSCVIPSLQAGVARSFIVTAINQVGTSGDSSPSNTVVPTPAIYKPDAMVGKTAATAVTGSNRYPPTVQTFTVNAKRNTTAVILWRNQNDGNKVDKLRIQGTGTTAKFTVSYFQGAVNKTASVVPAAGYLLNVNVNPTLFAPTMTLKVKVAANAAINSIKTITLRTKSSTTPTKTDVVTVKVKVIR